MAMSKSPAAKTLSMPHTAAFLTELPAALAGSISLQISTKNYLDRDAAEAVLTALVERLGQIGGWHVEFEPEPWFGRGGVHPTWLSANTWGKLYVSPRFAHPADLDERQDRAAVLIGNLVVPPLGDLRLLGLADWVAKPLIAAENQALQRLADGGVHPSFARRAAAFEAIRAARRDTLGPWLVGDFGTESELATFRLIHAEAPSERAYALAALAAGHFLPYDPVADPGLAVLLDDLILDKQAELRQHSYGTKGQYARRGIRLARRMHDTDVLSLPATF